MHVVAVLLSQELMYFINGNLYSSYFKSDEIKQ